MSQGSRRTRVPPVSEPRLRHSVRALVLDEQGRVLLCRFDLQDQGIVVWVPPGGGVEAGESAQVALVRELYEELGIRLDHEVPQLWTQRVVSPGHAAGYDGMVSDCYLLRTTHFEPCGSLGANALRAEGISELRWWTREELLAHRGAALFGPRNLPALVDHFLDEGIPAQPMQLGL